METIILVIVVSVVGIVCYLIGFVAGCGYGTKAFREKLNSSPDGFDFLDPSWNKFWGG